MNHVNSKLLITLATTAIFSIGASVWINNYRHTKEEVEDLAYVLPELKGRVNEVKKISIVGAENKILVTLDNGDNGWTVLEKTGYQADTGKLRKLLLNVADAQLLQAKTAKSERYAELGVEDINAKDAKGLVISLEGLGEPAKLLIGNMSSNDNGTFVRLPDHDQSWLTDAHLMIERNPTNWLNKELTNIAAERISEVILSKQDNKSLRLIKANPNDSNFQVSDLPMERELTSPGILNSLASTLTGLSLDDVETLSTVPVDQSVNSAHYRTFDGVIVDVTTWTINNKHYAQFKASLDQTLADQAQQHQSLQSEVETLQQRFQNRQFVIPEYKYATMVKTLNDLLKPLNNKSSSSVEAKSSPKTLKH